MSPLRTVGLVLLCAGWAGAAGAWRAWSYLKTAAANPNPPGGKQVNPRTLARFRAVMKWWAIVGIPVGAIGLAIMLVAGGE